jgi:hypothetical protein
MFKWALSVALVASVGSPSCLGARAGEPWSTSSWTRQTDELGRGIWVIHGCVVYPHENGVMASAFEQGDSKRSELVSIKVIDGKPSLHNGIGDKGVFEKSCLPKITGLPPDVREKFKKFYGIN